MNEDADDWDSQFASVAWSKPQSIQGRAKKERRTQKTEKQRERVATRPTQINFRCSYEFKADAMAAAKALRCSVADLMEMLLDQHMQRGEPNAP